VNLAKDPPPPSNPGHTHPAPNHPKSPERPHPVTVPKPAPAKTSTLVPSVCEPSGHGAPSGTVPARAGDLRGDLARAGTQTPAVVVGSGGGG
jgi:hypothetical protein